MGNEVEKKPEADKKPDPAPTQPPAHAPQAGPGVRALMKLIHGNASPDAEQVARLLGKYPDERAAMLETIQQEAGNTFASRVLAAERAEAARLKPSLEAGPGVQVKPVGETDDRYDNAENLRRANDRDQNERDAQAHGESYPNPVKDLIKPKPKQLDPAPEVDRAIQQARDQINGVTPDKMEIDPVTLLPIVPGLNKPRKKHL